MFTLFSIYFLVSNMPHLMYCVDILTFLYLYDDIDRLYYLYINHLPTTALFCQMMEVK